MIKGTRAVLEYTGRRCVFLSRSYSSLSCNPRSTPPAILSRHRPLSTGTTLQAKKRRGFFSSNAGLRQAQNETKDGEQVQAEGQNGQAPKRKKKRSPPGKTSLRRVAVEAQRSRDGNEPRKIDVAGQHTNTRDITAICAAEQYDIARVSHILQTRGYQLDPYGTGLYPQVVHVEIVVENPNGRSAVPASAYGDVFIFPSGTVVGWAVPDHVLSGLVSDVLLPAAENPHPNRAEEEDLEYTIDPNRENSSIKGDTVLLGTKPKSKPAEEGAQNTQANIEDYEEGRSLDTVLAKIAFSSGLARSTKLAVLESLLNSYFLATKSIPQQLSLGRRRLPFTRSFILQKTGQLLNIRAQLNLYSELADSLPDMFWDSRHELGLEGYYDQVGKSLDTNIRIKTLNDRMDYAQEIASILRQQLSEAHGVRLEWIIIILIMVEVGFEFRHVMKEYLAGMRGEGREE